MESAQQEEILAPMHEVGVVDFEELKILQRMDLKLLDIRWKVRKSRGPAHYSLSRDRILLFINRKVIPTN